jgi:hypothetical protein
VWRPVVDRIFFTSQLEQFLPCVYLPHSWSLGGCLLVSPLLHLRLALCVSILANNEIPKRKKNSRIFCAVHSLTRIFRTNRTMCSLFLSHSWSSRGCCGLSSIFILLLLVTICFVNDDVKGFSKSYMASSFGPDSFPGQSEQYFLRATSLGPDFSRAIRIMWSLFLSHFWS